MKQQNYTADTIKQAVDDIMDFTDIEIKLLAGKDKKQYDTIKLAVSGVIDHLYTRLGLGRYSAYLEAAKVLSLEDE